MSWHVCKELRSDKVAESRIRAVKTKLLKKHYSGLFTTKQKQTWPTDGLEEGI